MDYSSQGTRYKVQETVKCNGKQRTSMKYTNFKKKSKLEVAYPLSLVSVIPSHLILAHAESFKAKIK